MRDERRHMMLASVALISTAAAFWSLRLIKADPGTVPPGLDSLAAYIGPVAQPRASDTSMAFMLPLSDPFDRSVRPAPTHLNIPALPDSIVPVPAPVVIPPTPNWKLTAIVTSPRGRRATVDDSIVTVGSSVRGGGKITRIEQEYIEITDAQGRIHLVRFRQEN
jgi:hypothetical protein